MNVQKFSQIFLFFLTSEGKKKEKGGEERVEEQWQAVHLRIQRLQKGPISMSIRLQAISSFLALLQLLGELFLDMILVFLVGFFFIFYLFLFIASIVEFGLLFDLGFF